MASTNEKEGSRAAAEKARGEMEAAAKAGGQGLVRELWGYLWSHKKWWLVPVILALLVLTALIVLGSTGAAPFVYTLF